jgi:hypothetical protein
LFTDDEKAQSENETKHSRSSTPKENFVKNVEKALKIIRLPNFWNLGLTGRQ